MDLFPIPGSALTGHTDAVEHTIDTGDNPPPVRSETYVSPENETGGRLRRRDVVRWTNRAERQPVVGTSVVLVTKKTAEPGSLWITAG